MLTLDNFEANVDKTILQRGKSYFKSGAVVDLEAFDNHWTATVRGSDDYEVEIGITPEGLVTHCDCPYDWGMYCKHVIAVLYAIREEQSNDNPKVKAKKKERQSVNKLVQSLNRDQLLEIVLEQIKKDKSLGNMLLLKYSDEPPEKITYVRMVQNIISKYRGHRGYLDYRESSLAGNEIYTLQHEANEAFNASKYQHALMIAQAIIETVAPTLANADDSGGELGSCVSEAIELLDDIAKTLEGEAQTALFDYCLTEAQKKGYQDYGFEWELLDCAGLMVKTPEQRDQLFNIVDTINASRPQHHYGRKYNYYEDQTMRLKLSVVERLSTDKTELWEFLKQNQHTDPIRQRLIREYINEGNYTEAGRICNQAMISVKNTGMYGLENQYRAILMEIAKLQGDNSVFIALLEEQFLTSRNFSYYEQLKSYFPAKDWSTYVEKLIAKIQPRDYPERNVQLLVQIYAQEARWRDVMKIAKGGIETLHPYLPDLDAEFPEEMCTLYEKAVFRLLKEATGRETYRQATSYLHRMLLLDEPERVAEIIELLKAEYPKRKAMIQELDKVSA